MQIVLSNGSIVNASANNHEDLFWALKGGGPNFGVVTRYDVYTTEIPAIWIQASVYQINQSDMVLDAFYEWQTRGGARDLKSTVSLYLSIDTIAVTLVYTEPSFRTPAAFAPFENLHPLQVALPATNSTFGFLQQLQDSAFSSAPRRYVNTSTQVSQCTPTG